LRRGVLLGTCGLLTLLIIAPSFGSATASGPPPDAQTIRYLQKIARDSLVGRPDSQRDTLIAPSVAIDPANPLGAVAVFQQGRFGGGGALAVGYATTTDGGQTWTPGLLPGLTIRSGGEWDRASDSVVAFGPGGAAYASSVVFEREGFCPSGIAVQRSADGGSTWADPVVIQRDEDCANFNDKVSIAVDTNPASPFSGRIYVVWERTESGRSIAISWSDDGATWSAPVQFSPEEIYAVSPVAVVQPDGDLTVVYSDWLDDFLVAQTSTDGGHTFGPAVNVSPYEAVSPSDLWTGSLNNRSSVSADPVTGLIHVVWQDGRFRSDGLNDVVLTRSANGGSSWSPPQRVNLDPPDSQVDHLTPAVAAIGGTVHVTYLHRDMAVGLNQEITQHYIVSLDGGVTFGGDVQIGQSWDLTWATRLGNDYYALLGEYMGLAANDQFAIAVWPRSTTPRDIARVYHQTMWAARIEP
jgi:hypothetical protein